MSLLVSGFSLLPAGAAVQDGGFQATPAQQKWWAFQPVKSRPVPGVKNKSWPRNEIDRFVAAELDSRGMQPAVQADRRTWLRRVTVDLTGLPPTPAEVDVFIADTSDMAFERVVDRLLASPQYGQRWARHWLDAVRYADYHDADAKARNPICEPVEAWRYRDWVVESLNRDMPYDQFIAHQIAGDLLAAPDGQVPYADGLIATTFLVNGVWDRGDADKEKMVSDMVDDQIDTVGKAFMGLTLGCARCHDHKFDPVSQTDYYALAGIFYSTRMLKELGTKGGEITLQRRALVSAEVVDRRQQLVKQIAEVNAKLAELDKATPKPPADDPARLELAKRRDQLQKDLPPEPPVALAVSEGGVPGGLFPGIQDVPLHIRGSYTRLGAVVPRGLPAYFAGTNQPPIRAGSGRRELVSWIAAKENPLTARVAVNRVWQGHFGSGLVATPNNFGLNSQPPSHPALLDWLASRFVEEGWSLKKLHRRIVLSATYRQSSIATRATHTKDPDNRWLGRFTARRLDAESIRDAMMLATGRLDTKPGGPADAELSGTRRSLYLQTARWDRGSFATLFDTANPDACSDARIVSTVAPQALFLLNSSFMRDQSQHLAERLLREVPDTAPQFERARIHLAYRILFSRTASAEELAIAAPLVNSGPQAGKLAAWADLAHALLCSNELVYVD